MSRHDDSVRLGHMLNHAVEAVEACRTRTRTDLDTDRFFNLGLVRLIEIVGEAAARVSEPTRHNLPQIPWPQVTGMRNHLVHGYDKVNFDLLWDTVQIDLPPLIEALKSALGRT